MSQLTSCCRHWKDANGDLDCYVEFADEPLLRNDAMSFHYDMEFASS